MSVLESVLAYKERQRQNQLADIGQISNAVQMFQQARQQAIQNKMLEAELSQKDRQYKSDLEQQVFENTIKTAQQKSMEDYLKLLGGQGASSQQQTTSIPPQENAMPTLQDLIPAPEQSFIQTPYLSPTGKVGVSNKLDPEYSKKLEMRNSNIKDIEEYSKPVESFAVGIKQLRDAVKNTPDNAPGFLSKPIAKAKNVIADISNEKWYTDYNLAYQQNLLPAAQALGSSKVLSDRDLENIKQSLGDYSTPKETKIKALDGLTKKIGEAAKTKLNAYGVDQDKYSKIYPNISREFGIGKSEEFNPATHKKQRNKKTGEIRIVPR